MFFLKALNLLSHFLKKINKKKQRRKLKNKFNFLFPSKRFCLYRNTDILKMTSFKIRERMNKEIYERKCEQKAWFLTAIIF